jgi:hypothetical protein
MFISVEESHFDPILIQKSAFQSIHSVTLDQESSLVTSTEISDFPERISAKGVVLSSEHPKKDLRFRIVQKNPEKKEEVSELIPGNGFRVEYPLKGPLKKSHRIEGRRKSVRA